MLDKSIIEQPPPPQDNDVPVSHVCFLIMAAFVAFVSGQYMIGGVLAFITILFGIEDKHPGTYTSLIAETKVIPATIVSKQRRFAEEVKVKETESRLKLQHDDAVIDVRDKETLVPTSLQEDNLVILWQALKRVPHILVKNKTGAGKSVFVRALCNMLVSMGAEVWILDIKTAKRHVPPGVNLISDDQQWETTLQHSLSLFNKRLDEWREAPTDDLCFKPIWYVFDEAQNVMAIDGCKEIIEKLIRQGREVAIHIILASQDSQAKNLRLEGQSELLCNLTTCEITLNDDGQRTVTVNKKTYQIPELPTVYNTAPSQDSALLQNLVAKEVPADPDSEPLTTTTTTTTKLTNQPPEPPNQAESAEAALVVVNSDPDPVIEKGVVSLKEQITILEAARESLAANGKVNRSAVAERVFDGKSGGIHSRKVRVVLDAVGM